MTLGLRMGVIGQVLNLVLGSDQLQIYTRKALNLDYLFTAQQSLGMLRCCPKMVKWGNKEEPHNRRI